MKVIIQVGGKFHAFHLAKGLSNRGILKMMFTSYPKFKIENKIPKELVYALPIKELLKKIIDYFVPKKFFSKINYYNDDLFDLGLYSIHSFFNGILFKAISDLLSSPIIFPFLK